MSAGTISANRPGRSGDEVFAPRAAEWLLGHRRFVASQDSPHFRCQVRIAAHAGEQRAEQPDLLLGDLLGQPSHGLHQGLPQITRPGRGRRACGTVLNCRGHQHGLAGVAPVDRGFAHAGFGRDRLDGQLVVSDLDQQFQGRVEDRQVSAGVARPAPSRLCVRHTTSCL